jgi:hypothetical protein
MNRPMRTRIRAAGRLYAMNDPAASSGVSQEIWMMDAASGGESDPSERPEARSPIIQKNWNQNERASGRPIEKIYDEPNKLMFFKPKSSYFRVKRMNTAPNTAASPFPIQAAARGGSALFCPRV